MVPDPDDRPAATRAMLTRPELNHYVLYPLLFLDGLILGIISVAFVNLYVGTVAAPVGILVAAGGNALLLWLASGYAPAPWNWLPVIGWALVVAVSLGTGPGGDVLFLSDWRVAALVVAGVAAPVAVNWLTGMRRRIDAATSRDIDSAVSER